MTWNVDPTKPSTTVDPTKTAPARVTVPIPTSVGIIDDFESGDLSNWDTVLNGATVNKTAAISDTYGLELPDRQSGEPKIRSGKKLPNYPAEGYVFAWEREMPCDGNVSSQMLFARAADTPNRTTGFYIAYFDAFGQEFEFRKKETNGTVTNFLFETDGSPETAGVYRESVGWMADGKVYLIRNNSGKIEAMSGNHDTTYKEGGVEVFFDGDNNNACGSTYIDHLENKIKIPQIENFDNGISSYGGSTSYFTVQTNETWDGNTLKATGDASTEPSISDTDISLTSGEAYVVRVKPDPAGGAKPQSLFFTQSEADPPGNHYLVDVRGGDFELFKYDSGYTSLEKDTSVSTSNKWYSVLFAQMGGRTSAGLFDEGGALSLISSTDTSISSGGFGARHSGFTSNPVYFDKLERVL